MSTLTGRRPTKKASRPSRLEALPLPCPSPCPLCLPIHACEGVGMFLCQQQHFRAWGTSGHGSRWREGPSKPLLDASVPHLLHSTGGMAWQLLDVPNGLMGLLGGQPVGMAGLGPFAGGEHRGHWVSEGIWVWDDLGAGCRSWGVEWRQSCSGAGSGMP